MGGVKFETVLMSNEEYEHEVPLHNMGENATEDELDEEVYDLHPSRPWWSIQGSSRKILLAAGVAVILVLSCLGIALGSTALAMHYSYEEQIAGNPGNGDVLTTSEYQITFPKSSLEGERDLLVDEWMQYWKQQSIYYSTATQTSSASILRYQYYIDMTGRDSCDSSDRIRVRVYDKISSDQRHESGTTVDIKGDVRFQRNGLKKPFWPNSTLPSQQKLEHDFHECSEKYSRESRVYLSDVTQQFPRCRDISDLFPWALQDKYKDNKVKQFDSEYWWVKEYSGWLANDTRFLIAATFRYTTLEAAKSGEPAATGEWSIRLFSLQDGRSKEYNEDVVADAHNGWQAMIDHFGNGECRS